MKFVFGSWYSNLSVIILQNVVLLITSKTNLFVLFFQTEESVPMGTFMVPAIDICFVCRIINHGYDINQVVNQHD